MLALVIGLPGQVYYSCDPGLVSI